MAEAPFRLFLIDGSALAYRSHFAMSRDPLINSRGENTSAVYLFLRTLRSLLDRESPTHIAVVFDTREPTFRHRAFADYKATREKMPDDLVRQLPLIRELVEAMGIPLVERPGFEADDVIGTLARRAAADGADVFLVSRDKDFMQLLGDHVRMVDLGRGIGDAQVLGPEAAQERFGVPPEQVIEVLGLMGDSSDNVPGVPGIGEKTARKLIDEYGSIERAIAAAEEGAITGRAGKNLVEFAEQARLSRTLVTIDTDVALDVEAPELQRGEGDQDALRALYGRLEFKDLLDEIEEGESDEEARDYRVVGSVEELDALIATLRDAKRFVFDLETTDLDPRAATIVGISFAIEAQAATYVPFNANPSLFGGEAEAVEDGSLFPPEAAPSDRDRLLEALRPVFEDPAIAKCGQNVKYDLLVLAHNGIDVRGIAFDTMVAAYLDDPGARQHGLDALALRFLRVRKIATEALIGTGKKQISMAEVPVEQVGEYACEDADITWRLWELFEPRLRELEMAELNRDVEVPLIGVLLRMEQRGIRVDPEPLAAFGDELRADLEALERDLHELAGESFNVLSPKQLQPILYEKLKVHEALGKKRIKRTKTGLSTDQSVLEDLREHPFVEKLLDYRQKSKLLNTYVDALPALIDPDDGRIHTSFNQTVAATGRLSSSNPNLQNIPIRTEIGRRIRSAFVPREGWHLVSADYSQVELRILAHLSQDEALLDAFRRNADIHRETAARIFDIEPDAVDLEIRSRAKAINFGILYGMGPRRLARDTGITEAEAKAFIAAYFERFPAVKAFLDASLESARKNGYVTTLLHRRRQLPEIRSKDQRVRAQAENIAVNTPIQGTAADLIKVAMVALDRRIDADGLEAALLLQVHDELLFEAPADEVERLKAVVNEEMTGALSLDVPLVVDFGEGTDWRAAHA